ncbi:hypothetical protein E0I61_12190 [Flavobacterium ranwuense]|uniref:Uncharacterized protein n=1 Tax=Flavobacterium ranwuense TaxID=2541725 RepID=A0ABY2DQH5_9FLAO|nr:hypothetical protein [Flavobacterium ranwuense]TDE28284.1 hypothetical protein E0I61_12190 [Flavobacterium ranwuense]
MEIAHQNKRKSKTITFCKANHFITDGKTISSKHPDYDILAPIIMELKIRARKLILSGIVDVEKTYQDMLAIDFSQIGFLDYADKLITVIGFSCKNETQISNYYRDSDYGDDYGCFKLFLFHSCIA